MMDAETDSEAELIIKLPNTRHLIIVKCLLFRYKLSAAELRLKQTLLWHSTDFDRESCTVKESSTVILTSCLHP